MADEIVHSFKNFISEEVAVPVAAMNSLIVVIKNSQATTWMELEKELKDAISVLKKCRQEDLGGRTNISLGSGCDIFMKYVSRAFNMESTLFSASKEEILRRGERLAKMSLNSRHNIAKIGHSFIEDGSTILTHGYSRVVSSLLLKAAETQLFNIIITEGRPNSSDSAEAVRLFRDAGIPITVISDSAVGLMMDQVDFCVVGAEGVMENGGIVNKLGTFQLAMIAKSMKKPFYVAVESYKFARMYPLTQKDLLAMCQPAIPNRPSGIAPLSTKDTKTGEMSNHSVSMGMEVARMPTIDLTPPEYITLLFTDLGVLTPAAVSDELIQLYQ